MHLANRELQRCFSGSQPQHGLRLSDRRQSEAGVLRRLGCSGYTTSASIFEGTASNFLLPFKRVDDLPSRVSNYSAAMSLAGTKGTVSIELVDEAQHVFGEPFQHLLLQQEFIHD